MSLPPFATVEYVEARLRRELEPDEVVQAEAFIDDASDLIRAESGRDWVNEAGDTLEGTPAQLAALGRVCANAAARVMRNPSGVNQRTAGPFSESFGTNATPAVFLTKAERAIIAHVSGRTAGMTTVSTTRGPVETPRPFDPFEWVDPLS